MTADERNRRREHIEFAASFIVSWWREFAIGILAIASVWAFLSYGKAQRAVGAANEIVRVQDSTLKLRVPLVKVYDTKLVHDTLKLSRIITRLDSIRDTMRVTDTIWVKQYIATADSTVKACRELSADCEQYRQNASAVIVAQDVKIRALESLKKSRPCGFAWSVGPSLVKSNGYHAGVGVTAGIGCRF